MKSTDAPDKYDVEIVMNQTSCTREVAIESLKKHNFDLTAAICAITDPKKSMT